MERGSTPSASFTDGSDGTVRSDLCESTWCAYAWPGQRSKSGNRTFFVNQSGSITSNEDALLSGSSALDDRAGVAFERGGSPKHITGRIAVGTVGRDGSGMWKSLN